MQVFVFVGADLVDRRGDVHIKVNVSEYLQSLITTTPPPEFSEYLIPEHLVQLFIHADHP